MLYRVTDVWLRFFKCKKMDGLMENGRYLDKTNEVRIVIEFFEI